MKQQDQGQAARPRKSREEVQRCIASLVDEIARLLAKVDALSREEIAIGLEVLAERDHGGRHARTERYCARGYRPDVPPISCRNLDSTGQQMSARVGKTKRVTAQGTSDTKNDIMLYAIVEAESHQAAAKTFEGHPHLQIPQSSIEVMEIHPLPGM